MSNVPKDTQSIPQSVISWLAAGERGISSEAIVSHIWKLPVSRWGKSAPVDPDDLKRCLKLLEASPETKTRFSEMASASPEWKALVTRWGELERLFLEEAGDLDWSSRRDAKRTYRAMQECFRE